MIRNREISVKWLVFTDFVLRLLVFGLFLIVVLAYAVGIGVAFGLGTHVASAIWDWMAAG